MVVGMKGWLRPRKPDGSWYDWNLDTSTGNWDAPTYEGNAVEYQFAASFDVQGMICLYGGTEAFIRRLDFMFATAFDPGNEPSFLSPFLYIYAGAYAETVRRTRALLEQHYTAKYDGIPGNDDSGAMGSYFIWLSLGLYPSTATDIYLISSPTWRRAEIRVFHTHDDDSVPATLTIIAHNLTRENKYIGSASLNGRTLERAWFRHHEIADGGELVYVMTDEPTEFGTRIMPPSDTSSSCD